jgi:hypothetical protein
MRIGDRLLGSIWIGMLMVRFLWMLALVGLCLYALSGLAPVSFRPDEKLGLVGCALFFGWVTYRRGRAIRAATGRVVSELRPARCGGRPTSSPARLSRDSSR